MFLRIMSLTGVGGGRIKKSTVLRQNGENTQHALKNLYY